METILILASNPQQDLNLDREIRDLKGVIERASQRQFSQQRRVEIALAVRPSDLQELLLRIQPQIVHFCGHGTGETGLMLENQDGQAQLVSTTALSDLFRLFTDRGLACVLLNACYSAVQAKAMVEHIPTVIGMQQAIRDDAAIAFATGFYRALSYDCSIETAFQFGCNAIQLQLSPGIPADSALEADRKANRLGSIQDSPLPEHLKPVLMQKAASQPQNNFNDLPAETSREIQLQVDQSLEKEAALKQYREQVRVFLENRSLSEVEKIRLKKLRQQLGLSLEEADQILAAAQKPLQQGQQAYRDLLLELVENGCYPFEPSLQAELNQFQQECGLTDAEVSEISAPLLASAQLQSQEFEVITLTPTGEIAARTRQAAQVFTEILAEGVSLELVSIPAGELLMGSPPTEEGRSEEESPQHLVQVSAFLIGKYPITQAQWQVVARWTKVALDLDPDPASFKSAHHPVEQVSWEDVVEFCQRLSQKTGRPYRLPSEAEWEYAARAGTQTPFHFGNALTTDFANFNGHHIYGSGSKGIYRQTTTPVGSLAAANAFGLYDLHGNVWEWCADPWHSNYEAAPTDGSPWIAGGDESRRILRGGAWFYDPWDCRSAYRTCCKAHYRDNQIGFRVVCGWVDG